MADPVTPPDLIAAVRDQRDPVRRARLAGDLMTRFQQAQVELSRLRRQAIEDAATSGLSYSEIARQVGLTRGRISQIRTAGPAPERELFGIGPLQLGVPLRPIPGRDELLVASEDLTARDNLIKLLTDLAFQVDPIGIEAEVEWDPPPGELIAICGPKSSPTIARLLADDPVLSFTADSDGRWSIERRGSGERFESPMDDPDPQPTDVAYLGRLPLGDQRTLLLIAGVHAIGSTGVVHYLSTSLNELHQQVGTANFSTVIRSDHDGGEILRSEIACSPILH